MVTRYLDIIFNDEVTDVLFHIILDGSTSVKELTENLQQPQSTISTKLMFLRQNGVVNKDKWKYSINYPKLRQLVKKAFNMWVEDQIVSVREDMKFSQTDLSMRRLEAKIEDLDKLKGKMNSFFTEEELDRFIDTFGWTWLYMKKKLYDIVEAFFVGLVNTPDSKLKRLGSKYVEIKSLVGRLDTEEKRFFEDFTGGEDN